MSVCPYHWAVGLGQRIKHFADDRRGAVTLDWMVMTAAVVGLGISAIAVAGSGIENLSGDIGTTLSDFNLASNFDSEGEAADNEDSALSWFWAYIFSFFSN